MSSTTTIAIGRAVTGALSVRRIAATPVRMVVEPRRRRHGAGRGQPRAGAAARPGASVVSRTKVPHAS